MAHTSSIVHSTSCITILEKVYSLPEFKLGTPTTKSILGNIQELLNLAEEEKRKHLEDFVLVIESKVGKIPALVLFSVTVMYIDQITYDTKQAFEVSSQFTSFSCL